LPVSTSPYETLGDGLDPLRQRAHLCYVTAGVHVMAAHTGRHPSESSRIVKGSGQPFAFLEIPPHRRELVQREERLAKVKMKVDRALELLARVGQWVQGRQCPLEAGHRLPVGRAGESLGTRLPEVSDRLLPHLAPEGVVSQALDLLGQPIGVERLDRLYNPGMECAPAVVSFR
jgi:hypothetical protein